MRRSHTRAGGGPSIETLEDRRLLSVSPLTAVTQQTVTIGTGAATGVTFLADNGHRTGLVVGGTTATITFSGPVTPHTTGGRIFFPLTAIETIDSIVFTNAIRGHASFTVQGSGLVPLINVGSITGGDLGSINAVQLNLVGAMHLASVNNINLGAVTGGSMDLGAGVASIKIRGVLAGSITAGSIGKISAFELARAAISTTGLFSKGKLQIGSIDGGAGIEQSEIFSAGNIGSVRAKFIESSVITAATNAPASAPGTFPVSRVPEFSTAFSSPATIHSVQVVRAPGAGFFNNSIIAARTIGSLQLGQLGAAPSGIAAHTFGAVSVMSPAGSLNQVSLHLGSDQLHTSTKLATTLTNHNVANQSGVSGPDNVLLFDLNWNVLR